MTCQCRGYLVGHLNNYCDSFGKQLNADTSFLTNCLVLTCHSHSCCVLGCHHSGSPQISVTLIPAELSILLTFNMHPFNLTMWFASHGNMQGTQACTGVIAPTDILAYLCCLLTHCDSDSSCCSLEIAATQLNPSSCFCLSFKVIN